MVLIAPCATDRRLQADLSFLIQSEFLIQRTNPSHRSACSLETFTEADQRALIQFSVGLCSR